LVLAKGHGQLPLFLLQRGNRLFLGIRESGLINRRFLYEIAKAKQRRHI
jgi:hypothetical protein